MTKSKPEKPIRRGAKIRKTNLQRRWQEKREVAPAYIGDEILHADRTDAAFTQALNAGYKSVVVDGFFYANIGGEWFGMGWSRDNS